MPSLADIYNEVKDYIAPAGGQGLFEAFKTNASDRKKKREDRLYGFHQYDQPVLTNHGYVNDTQSMDYMMDMAKQERAASMQPQAQQSLTQQYTAPVETPILQEPVVQPQILGAQSKKAPTYSEEQKRKAINKFTINASRVDPNLPFRSTPEKAKENANYINQYLNEVFNKAPQYGLDPMMITAIAAQESGWGGQRYGNNLVGYGVFESGQNLDTDHSEKAIPEAVDALLQKISTDWGGQYQGKTTPEGFVESKYKWNVHPSWVQNVGIIRNSLN